MKALAIAALLTLPIGSAHAGLISWTDWIDADTGNNATARGSITIGSDIVNVTYTGDIYFTQLGPYSTTNFWTEPVDTSRPYTGNTVVDNAPLPGEMIALWSAGIVNTLTFSRPVKNPILPVVSLGRPSQAVTYDFDTPFSLLSNGIGWWSFANDYKPGAIAVSAGDMLTGSEVHAAIQTFALFGLGFAGMGVFRRRSNNKPPRHAA